STIRSLLTPVTGRQGARRIWILGSRGSRRLSSRLPGSAARVSWSWLTALRSNLLLNHWPPHGLSSHAAAFSSTVSCRQIFHKVYVYASLCGQGESATGFVLSCGLCVGGCAAGG